MKIEHGYNGNIIIELKDGTKFEVHATRDSLLLVLLEHDVIDVNLDALNVVTLRKKKDKDVK